MALLPKKNDMRTNIQLIEGLFKIRSKRRGLVPFKLNPAQHYYMTKRRRRNIILKARQKGISKVIDADQLIDCISAPTNAVVISHEQLATERLFEAVSFFIENCEVKPVTSTDNAKQIVFPKRGSTYFVGTAGQRAFGRGDTIDRAHLSEAAFYHDLEKILAGVAEAAEYGQIDIESTPNGRDAFYQQWKKAREGKSPYTPIFIPWFIDREYSSDSLTETERTGLSDAVQNIFNLSDSDFRDSITKEERALMDRVKKQYGNELLPGQIKWRRYKIWDKGEIFFQEYPEDEETCFLQSGRPVFKYVTVRPELQVDVSNLGALPKDKIEWLRTRVLVAGQDCAEGVEGGDNHAIAILDVTPGRQAYVLWETVSNEYVDVFCQKAHNMFNALLNVGVNVRLFVEKQGVGVATISNYKRLGTAFEEWNTTESSRSTMLTELEEGYRKEELLETFSAAQTELLNMYFDKNNKAVHPQGQHDDRVFARAIAYQVARRPGPGLDWL